jgi:hypothetical protein
MPTRVQIDGVGTVELDDSFKSLPPDQQQATINEIAASHGGASSDQPDTQSGQPAPQGFTDEQKASILGYLPKAKDAADLTQFAHDVSGGTHTIGNAQQILDYLKQGGDPSKLQFADPVAAQVPAQQPSTLDSLRNTIGDGILNALDSVIPGLGSVLRGNRDSGKAATEHVANSMVGDYGPEVGGLLHTILSPSEYSEFGANLDRNVAHERAILQNDSSDHPVASVAGELGGAAIAAPLGGEVLDSANILNSGSKLATAARASIGGGIYGSGSAGPGNRLEGGAIGAVTAPILGAVVKAPVALFDAAKSVLADSPGAARRIIAKAIEADQNTPASVGADVASAHANGVPAMIADTGENTRGLLAAASRSSGVARTVARDALDERQAGLADRVTQAIQRDLGPVANPHEVADTLMTKARDDAAPLYDSAYTKPGAAAFGYKVTPLLQRPSMQKAMSNAYRIAAEEGRDPTSLGFDLDPEGNVTLTRTPSWQTMDYVKRGLDDVIEGYRDPVTGRLNLDTEGRAINNTRTSFLNAFDNANPTYAQARQAWGGPVSGVNAMNTGRKFLNMTADDIEARMRDMTPFEKQMAALGARRAMAETVSSKGDTADVVNALVGTGKKRAMLARLFGDRQSFGRFVDTLNQEREGFRTFKTARLGSPTAPNLADDGALELATNAAEMVATHGLPIRAAVRYALKFGVGKVGDKTKEQVAALLSNTDPARFNELASQLRDESVRRGLLNRQINVVARPIGNVGAADTAGQ